MKTSHDRAGHSPTAMVRQGLLSYLPGVVAVVVASLAWHPLAVAIRAANPRPLAAEIIASAILGVLFVFAYLIPFETDPARLTEPTKKLLAILRSKRARRSIAAALIVGGGACFLRVPFGAISGATLLGAVTFLLFGVATGILVRACLLPLILVQLKNALAPAPYVFVLVGAAVLATTGAQLLGGSWDGGVASLGLLWGMGFLLSDIGISNSVEQHAYRELNVDDPLWLDDWGNSAEGHVIRTLGEFNGHLRAGRVKDAERVLRTEGGRWDQKAYLKARARLLYRQKSFESVLVLLDLEGARWRVDSSTLASLEALCLAHVGRPIEAAKCISESIRRNPDNPYLRLTCGTVAWFRGDLDAAMESARLADRLHRARYNGRPCPIGLNNFAYYSCHFIMRRRKMLSEPGVCDLLTVAKDACKEAFLAIDSQRPTREYASLHDSLALVYMLEGQYALAGHHLRLSLSIAPNAAARNHLGVLYLIGSTTFSRSEYLFDTVLYELRDDMFSPEAQFARLNLDRIRVARQLGFLFSERIVYASGLQQSQSSWSVLARDAEELEGSKSLRGTLYLSLGEYLAAVHSALGWWVGRRSESSTKQKSPHVLHVG